MDRRQLLWPREDWPVVRRAALTIAACQLVALLTIGTVIRHVDGGKPAGTAVATERRSIR